MDGRTFDAIAKHLAARPSRRSVLKGLVGGVTASLALVLRRHRAEAAPCPAGTRPCNGNTCKQCCRTRHCPKGQTCHKGTCTPRGGGCVPIPGLGGGGCLDNTQCCSLTCQDEVCCNGLTHFCLTNDDCCSGHCDNQTCLSATCIPSGEACFRAAECCNDPFCSGGFCSSCLAFGANCQANPTACCAGICTGICICVEGTGACTTDDDCCSGACSNDGHCVCGARRTACESIATCCEGLFCNGTCCVPANAPCTIADACCDGSCTNGHCPCAPPGGICLDDDQCCSGSCGNNGCL